MGILDDAIREHLELKRSHGAPEDEVRFKEAEAFGAVRQEVTSPEAAVAEDQTAMLEPGEVEAAPPVEEETVQAAPPPPVEEPVEPAPEDPYQVHPGDHAVPDPHHEGEPGGSDPAWGEDTDFFSEPAAPAAEAEPEPEPESQPQPEHAEERHPALHDTDEHFRGHEHPPEPVFQHQAPVEEAPEASFDDAFAEPDEEPAAEEGDEDVLEETPEFLQDAPEHDRLWFEQKPPRDFDFGE